MRAFLVVLALLSLGVAASAQPAVIRSFPTSGFGSVFPGGLGYDQKTDHLWVADETNKKLYEITRSGQPVTTLDGTKLGMSLPIGAGVDPVGRLLYVADESTEDVFVIDLTRNAVITIQRIAATNTDVSGLDYNMATNTVVTTADGPGMIWEYDLNFKVVSSLNIKSIAGDADGLGSNPFNGLYIVGDDTGKLIVEIADDGHVLNQWKSTTYGIQDPEGVCMDPKNGTYFISTTSAPVTIYEVAGGLTLGPALTTDKLVVPKGQPFTMTLRTNPGQWTYGGIVLFKLAGGSIPTPLIMAQGSTFPNGRVKFTFGNPGLGNITATLVGVALNVSPFTFQFSNNVQLTLQ